jgi:hypothetical protein
MKQVDQVVARDSRGRGREGGRGEEALGLANTGARHKRRAFQKRELLGEVAGQLGAHVEGRILEQLIRDFRRHAHLEQPDADLVIRRFRRGVLRELFDPCRGQGAEAPRDQDRTAARDVLNSRDLPHRRDQNEVLQDLGQEILRDQRIAVGAWAAADAGGQHLPLQVFEAIPAFTKERVERLPLELGVIRDVSDLDAGPGEASFDAIEAAGELVERGCISGAGLDGLDTLEQRLNVD